MSDIAGFVEFPDGKVLSTTEWGGLLLWEGGLVKCEFSRKARKPCHAGPIECVYIDEGEVITAGADGVVRVRTACRHLLPPFHPLSFRFMRC
jgi:hypothetical protein